MNEDVETPETPQTIGQPAGEVHVQPLIEDHAMIGDLHTAALVTKDGSIDWLCLPAFDSDACFTSLLGGPENGRWKIAPSVPVREVRRRYQKDTLILETDFVTDVGTLRLIDFMAVKQDRRQLVRELRCLEGKVPVTTRMQPRFSFGSSIPRIQSYGDTTCCVAGPDALYLRGGPRAGAPKLDDEFTVSSGNAVSYVLTYANSSEPVPAGIDPVAAQRATARFWTDWVAQIDPPSRYRDEVVRSLITLKGCTYAPTGGIVAAPTTSLPETLGGIRNWDYRFTWLRDSVLALRALINAGVREDARSFAAWMLRAIAGDMRQVQIMYGIRGERRLTETDLPWLSGYADSRPVRVGNGAYTQFQLDVFGEIAGALMTSYRRFGQAAPEAIAMLAEIATFVSERWQVPDRGIWEMRGPERSFTASKVSAWAAIDSAIQLIEATEYEYPLEKLKAVRQEIFDEVCEKGFNAELNTFTQYYGGTALDASLLFIPLMGFLPATDPRVVGTVAALERELLEEGLLLRFKTEEGGEVDGLTGKEGTFLACSFWLVGTYQLMGRKDDARELFERLIGLSNDVGLLAEEYDPSLQRQLGNFPQAFSHFAMVNAAYAISGEAKEGSSFH